MENIKPELSRTAMLVGGDGVRALMGARVALFGVGGVGGHIAEALARAGVGTIALIDGDTVSLSNINRQIIATHTTVGRPKVEVMAERITDINPDCRVIPYNIFYSAENADIIDFADFDYIADAIDTVTSKLIIAIRARDAGVPMISAMGTGNKVDPTRLELTDISKTDTCPLARVMRRELKARGINHMNVVFSREPAATPIAEFYDGDLSDGRRLPPASLATVPAAAGLIIASKIISDIVKAEK